MNDQPRFDPTRSAAVKDMLMGVVARNAAPSRPKRAAVLIALVTGAIVLAGGGAAWAVSGLSPFTPAPSPAPTSVAPTTPASPTPTPTPTATVPAQPLDDPARPHSTVALSCDALGTEAGVGTLMPGAQVYNSDPYFGPELTPGGASFLQAGAQECAWSSSGAYLQVFTATDAESGRADVAAQVAGGATALDAGAGAALVCGPNECTVSLTAGSYWATLRVAANDAATTSSLARNAAANVAAALTRNPPQRQKWSAPASTWAIGDGCAALRTDRPMTELLGSKWITGPYAPGEDAPAGYPQNYANENPLWGAETHAIDCLWGSADGISQDPSAITRLRIQVASGARWAYDLSSTPSEHAQVTDVTVHGADAAAWVCIDPEGSTTCFLNVMTGGAWMRLGVGDVLSDTARGPLTTVAEAIIAAHNG